MALKCADRPEAERIAEYYYRQGYAIAAVVHIADADLLDTLAGDSWWAVKNGADLDTVPGSVSAITLASALVDVKKKKEKGE